MRNLTNGLLLAALLALPGALAAQAASVTATANVLANITVADFQDLDFGDVIPGFGETVAPDDFGNVGVFHVTGAGTLEVSLDFGTLPTFLTGPGVAELPLTFGAGSAGYGPDAGTLTAPFDPAAGANANLVNDELYVFIGGTVTAAVAQTPGTYTGTITLTVAYTGS
jgi:spore coat protein U-like protein